MAGARLLMTASSGYGQNSQTSVLVPPSGKQLRIVQAKVINRSGGAIDMGVLKSLGPANYLFGTIGTGVLTDQTAALQGGTATTIFTTTNNDGFLVTSAEKFNLIGLTISQAPSGGAPSYEYTYWNGAAWTALTTIAVPTYATGAALVLFASPIDWVVGGNAVTGIDATKFNIRVRATTAPNAVTGKATAVWIGQLLDFFPQVANNTSGEFKVALTELPVLLSGGEGLLPYFGGTANAANMVSAQYLVQE